MTTHTDLQRLAERATPGPWWSDVTNGAGGAVCRSEEVCAHGHFNICRRTSDMPHVDWVRNAHYIAAASPDRILSLLDELRCLRAFAELCADISTWTFNGRGDPNGSGFDLQQTASDLLVEPQPPTPGSPS